MRGAAWVGVVCLAIAVPSREAAASGPASAPATSVRELYVPLATIAAAALPASHDLSAFLDERPQTVVRVESGGSQWQVVIYFDAPLATPDGLRQTARTLVRVADQLAELGPTEIVLADPQPHLYLDRSRDPVAIREALGDLIRAPMTTGELQWHRQRYLEHTSDGAESSLASHALQEEVELLEQQRLALLHWLAIRDSIGPRLLVLVQNGYDLNPRSFFAEQTGGTLLEDPRAKLVHEDWARLLASEGWTVLAAALGPRPPEFNDPLGPLNQLVAATGGQVATSRSDLVRGLDRIGSWPVAVVRLEGPDDGRPRPFTVHDKASGSSLGTTCWATATRPEVILIAIGDTHESKEQRPVLRLLRPAASTAIGEVRLHTVTGHRRIDRVAFLLNGQEIAEDDSDPFTATIDLGPEARPWTVTAVAYSKTGRRMGEDSLELNMSPLPAQVTILQTDFNAEAALLTVSASPTSSHGESPVVVDFYLNQTLAGTRSSPPYIVKIPTSELAPRDFIRVVARYPDGSVAEAAKLPATAGPNDELDVNLVELLAMVRSRGRDQEFELESSDFVIRRQGVPTQIEHFARWDDLALTMGLVLDTSDSMRQILADTREAAERFFQQALRDEDEAFVVDFNTQPRLAHQKTKDSDQLLHALESLQARGDTALYDAIIFSLLQFEPSTGRRALVVLTDGEDSASRYQPRECVRQAKIRGVPVYLIILGTPPDPNREAHFLRNQVIANRTGGQVYYVSDVEDLTRIYQRIGEELRQQYFLTFSSDRSLSPEELREIEVEVVRKGISVQTLLASQQGGG